MSAEGSLDFVVDSRDCPRGTVSEKAAVPHAWFPSAPRADMLLCCVLLSQSTIPYS